jgi:hypothetical protein
MQDKEVYLLNKVVKKLFFCIENKLEKINIETFIKETR